MRLDDLSQGAPHTSIRVLLDKTEDRLAFQPIGVAVGRTSVQSRVSRVRPSAYSPGSATTRRMNNHTRGANEPKWIGNQAGKVVVAAQW